MNLNTLQHPSGVVPSSLFFQQAHLSSSSDEEIDSHYDQLSVLSNKFIEAKTDPASESCISNAAKKENHGSLYTIQVVEIQTVKIAKSKAEKQVPLKSSFETNFVGFSKVKISSQISESFFALLKSVFEGQTQYEKALSVYSPEIDHEKPFKFLIFHFFCKDKKNFARKKFLAIIDKPFEIFLEDLKTEGLLRNTSLKRGSSVRISAFCLLLRKMGLPSPHDENSCIINTDKYTQKFLSGFVKTGLSFEAFQEEISNLEGLKAYFQAQFDNYFDKRIYSLIEEVKKAKPNQGRPIWDLNVTARMVLSPIDFGSAISYLNKLIE